MTYSAASDIEKCRVRIERMRALNATLFGKLEFERQRLRGALALRRSRRAPDATSGQVAVLGELTPREREVLTCIAEGCSTKETASRLGITFKTAACHRHRIMQKLDVHETSSLVRFAIRSGLVRP